MDKIGTIRTVAKKLTPYLLTEGKIRITKPEALIPGAAAAAGAVMTIETKDNSANLVVQRDDSEIQRTTFNYKEGETLGEYELISAKSLYSEDNKDAKKLRQQRCVIEPNKEETAEYYINYANAPMKETTLEYIDQINSSVAQASGYKSSKTDYDPQESHTYGKKSLQRDIPVLLKVLDIIAPNAEFTLRMKDKLKRDNKTSLVAFEANDSGNGKELVRGFISANGDSVSYHIDTDEMTIVGEHSPNKNLSQVHLKSEKTAAEEKTDATADQTSTETTVSEEEAKPAQTTEEEKTETPTEQGKAETPESSAGEKPKLGRKPKYNDEELKEKIQALAAEGKNQMQIGESLGLSHSYISALMKKFGIQPCKTKEQNTQVKADEIKHNFPVDYYTDLILRVATADELSTKQKVEGYKNTLALAYRDGYKKFELYNILLGDGLHHFSKKCSDAYVRDAIFLAEQSDVELVPVQTLDSKIKDLQSIEIDTNDEDLKHCVLSMINEIAKIKDKAAKEACVNKALSLLKNNSSEGAQSDFILFVQEAGKLNDDLKLHYEIYVESVNDRELKALKTQIEKMINNISVANQHGMKGDLLSKLFLTENMDELMQLQNEVQTILNSQSSKQQHIEELPESGLHTKRTIESLSGKNQDLVNEILGNKRPRQMALTFDEVKNLLLGMGFTEQNVRGTHHIYAAPSPIVLKGTKRTILTVVGKGTKTVEPGVARDLMDICKQYYGDKK